MRYPSRSDYCCSIRNPSFAFRKKDSFTGRDVDLDSALVKGAAVERVHANGMRDVWSASGSFAIAFKYETPFPQKTWAVRCLYRSTFDVTQHYRQALRHLKRNPCQKYFVDFDFLQEGIRVQGKCYPILKMEWVEGSNLKKFIKANLRNPGKLRELADRWVELVRDLQLAGIAHGDFQHGNVLVVEEYGRLALKLIDYDSLYFTKARQIAEDSIKGISNYQHPLRQSLAHRCLEIDTFPAIVIYLSILALERNYKLWNNYDLDNTEGLLFAEADFLNPQQSSVFRNLRKLPKPISNLSQQLQEICGLEQFQQLPSLDEIIIGRTMAAGVTTQTQRQEEVSSGENAEQATLPPESLVSRIRLPQFLSHWSFGRHSKPQIGELSHPIETVEPTLAATEADPATMPEAFVDAVSVIGSSVEQPEIARHSAESSTLEQKGYESGTAESEAAALNRTDAIAAPLKTVQTLWQRFSRRTPSNPTETTAESLPASPLTNSPLTDNPLTDSSVALATEASTEPEIVINSGPVAWSPKTKRRSPQPQVTEAETSPSIVPSKLTADRSTPSNNAPSSRPETLSDSSGINWPVLFKELLEFSFRFSLGSVYLIAAGIVICLALPFYGGQASESVADESVEALKI